MGGLSDAFKSIGLSGGAGGALAAINPTAILGTMASGALDFAGAMWQNSQNKKAATTAWNRQLAMLEYQNAYNTPAEQMKRYKEAGLNPNLIYGQQNLSASASSVPMAASAPSTGLGKGVDRTFAALRLGQDLQLGQSQIEQIQANKALLASQIKKVDAETDLLRAELKSTPDGFGPRDKGVVPQVVKTVKSVARTEANMLRRAHEVLKNGTPSGKRDLPSQLKYVYTGHE